MAETLYLTRKMNALYASDGLAGNDLAKLPEGVRFKAVLTRPRSGKSNRLYRGLIALVHDNTDLFPTADALHQAVKQGLGYTRVYRRKGSTMTQEEAEAAAKQLIIVQLSTAYEKMDQPDFNDFLNRVIAFLCDEIIPGLGKAELLEQAREMLGEEKAA